MGAVAPARRRKYWKAACATRALQRLPPPVRWSRHLCLTKWAHLHVCPGPANLIVGAFRQAFYVVTGVASCLFRHICIPSSSRKARTGDQHRSGALANRSGGSKVPGGRNVHGDRLKAGYRSVPVPTNRAAGYTQAPRGTGNRDAPPGRPRPGHAGFPSTDAPGP